MSVWPPTTDPELLDRLRNLPPATPEQIAAQRRSWVVGEMGMGSDADEAEYASACAAGDAEWIARCDAKAQARMVRARQILKDMGL